MESFAGSTSDDSLLRMGTSHTCCQKHASLPKSANHFRSPRADHYSTETSLSPQQHATLAGLQRGGDRLCIQNIQSQINRGGEICLSPLSSTSPLTHEAVGDAMLEQKACAANHEKHNQCHPSPNCGAASVRAAPQETNCKQSNEILFKCGSSGAPLRFT